MRASRCTAPSNGWLLSRDALYALGLREVFHIDPPYAPDDLLWVRESLTIDDTLLWRYAADGAKVQGPPEAGEWAALQRRDTIPSIHMPRWASRFTLKITAVKVERLNEISDEDAKAEGVDLTVTVRGCTVWNASYHTAYASLWSSLHGPASWNANPWVVVLTFTAVRKNIDLLGTAGGGLP